MIELILGLSFLAFLFTLISTPYIGDIMKKRGFVGRDLHKEDGRKVPENGGIGVWAYFLVFTSTFAYISSDHWTSSVVLAAFLMGLLGLLDRVKRFGPGMKLAGFFIIGVALAWLTPITGYWSDGIILVLLFPFAFVAGVNFTNMLAGFNGLEIGTGAIAALGVAATAYLRGDIQATAPALILAFALLGFLYCNRYPATIFPGDVGTLIVGAVLVPCIFHAGAFLPGLIVFLPYIADAGLKFLSAGIMTREGQKPTEIKEGKLVVPEGANLSLPRVFLMKRPMSEKEVVAWIWALEALFVALAVSI